MIKIGTQKMLVTPCLGNPGGTIGVCYEVYERQPMGIDRNDDRTGYSFIFPNGRYDGFSTEETEMFFAPYEGFVPSCGDYEFKHVNRLVTDFAKGYFDMALKYGWINFGVKS